MASKLTRAAIAVWQSRHVAAVDVLPAGLPTDALDDRIAMVGTAGSGKTYAAKGFVKRLLDSGARVAIVDQLGVWWDCAQALTAAWPAIRSSSLAGSTPTCRSPPK